MEEQILQYLIPATGLITGLIGAFVGLQNRACWRKCARNSRSWRTGSSLALTART